MLYKRTADIVEAERFDGTPSHLVTSEFCRVNEVPSFVYHLNGPDGRTVVREGDYIVTTRTGERYVLAPELFEELYEPIASPFSANFVDSSRRIEEEMRRNADF